MDKDRLKTPARRRENGRIDPQDCVRIDYRSGWHKGLSFSRVLDLTQKAEIELRKRCNNSGFLFAGCSEASDPSGQGIVVGDVLEHVIEHACCAVLESKVPTHECAIGMTSKTGVQMGRHGELKGQYLTLISPPPSMSIREATTVVNKTLRVLLEDSSEKKISSLFEI